MVLPTGTVVMAPCIQSCTEDSCQTDSSVTFPSTRNAPDIYLPSSSFPDFLNSDTSACVRVSSHRSRSLLLTCVFTLLGKLTAQKDHGGLHLERSSSFWLCVQDWRSVWLQNETEATLRPASLTLLVRFMYKCLPHA
ncbi:hypothetical protein Q7C36_003031 [Tachysurus vachellii]|uniref:Uncharacterized protein n=1 Tax=Tachysurus vachellii TaxID=175792 RepID=A0AA88T4M4_TACVA|nr:hypothetical protein Q7C36_003031 [Tachysurus vachellii]